MRFCFPTTRFVFEPKKSKKERLNDVMLTKKPKKPERKQNLVQRSSFHGLEDENYCLWVNNKTKSLASFRFSRPYSMSLFCLLLVRFGFFFQKLSLFIFVLSGV